MIAHLLAVAFLLVGLMLVVLLWLLMTADKVHDVAGVRARPVACPECGWGAAAGLRAEPDDALTIVVPFLDGHDEHAPPFRRTTTVCWGCAEALTVHNVLDRS